MSVKISELGAASSLADANVGVVVQSGTTRKMTLELLREFVRDNAARWSPISTDDYTATPASTSRITCSDTGDFAVGLPVKHVYGGTSYYAIVTAISANAYIDIAGAPLDTGQDLTALYVGTPEMVVQLDFFIKGTYGNGVADLLAADMDCYCKWGFSAAYLVVFEAAHVTVDTGAEPKVNVKVGGSAVSTNDTNKGVQLGATATWVANSAIAINTTNYSIARGDAIEIACTEAGGNGDAENLTVMTLFVME